MPPERAERGPLPPGQRLSWASAVPLLRGGHTHLLAVIGGPGGQEAKILSLFFGALVAGERLRSGAFAGSRSLSAWRALSSAPGWTGEEDADFSPGPARAGQPGLLHLALRLPQGTRRDVLVTDVPTRWWADWALSPGATEAAGARRVVEAADALLLLLHPARFAASGDTRAATLALVERVGREAGRRPVSALLLQGEDPTAPIDPRLLHALQQHLPAAAQAAVSEGGERGSFFGCFQAVLEPTLRWRPPPSVPVIQPTPFGAWRGA